jgi:iron(III) transport system substrate-binding protein
VTNLNAREAWVAAGPSATTLESRDRGNPLAVVYPEDGAVLMVSPSGILKNAPAPNTARPTYEEIEKGIPEVKELFRETFGI